MRERLQILLDLQETFTKKKNQALVGSRLSVLVEGFSKRQIAGSLNQPYQAVQWTGRTSTNKIVNFYQSDDTDSCGGLAPGQLLDVKIEEAYSHSLWGKPVDRKATTGGLKGEKIYAA